MEHLKRELEYWKDVLAELEVNEDDLYYDYARCHVLDQIQWIEEELELCN